MESACVAAPMLEFSALGLSSGATPSGRANDELVSEVIRFASSISNASSTLSSTGSTQFSKRTKLTRPRRSFVSPGSERASRRQRPAQSQQRTVQPAGQETKKEQKPGLAPAMPEG